VTSRLIKWRGASRDFLEYIRNLLGGFNCLRSDKKDVMSKNRQVSSHQVPLQFGDAFFQDYAGKLVADTNVALVELVANCWDAGAKRVDITWPENNGGYFEITDDGHGMTKDDLPSLFIGHIFSPSTISL